MTCQMVWQLAIPMRLILLITNWHVAVSAFEALIVQVLASHNSVLATEQLVAS